MSPVNHIAPVKKSRKGFWAILLITFCLVLMAALTAIYLSEQGKQPAESPQPSSQYAGHTGEEAAPPETVEPSEGVSVGLDSPLVQTLLSGVWQSADGSALTLTVEPQEYGSLLALEILDTKNQNYLLSGTFYIDEQAGVFYVSDSELGEVAVSYRLEDPSRLQLTVNQQALSFVLSSQAPEE